MKYDIFGVGNALVDVQVQVTDDIVVQSGFEKGIMTLVGDDQQQGVLQSIEGHPLNRCADRPPTRSWELLSLEARRPFVVK